MSRNVNFVSTSSAEIDTTVSKDGSSNNDKTPPNNIITSPNNSAISPNNNITSPNNRIEKIIDLTKPTTSTLDFISIKDSGKDLVKVFKPFASNPMKQTRYESYLIDKDSLQGRDSGADKLNEWEREREMVEFEQAAKLYRPLTGIMGDR